VGKTVEELFIESSDLDDNNKAKLAGLLLESIEQPVDPDVEKLWYEEIENRLKSLDDGSAKLIPWEEVKSKVHSKLSERFN